MDSRRFVLSRTIFQGFDRSEIEEKVKKLSTFVKVISIKGITTKQEYRDWAKGQDAWMAEIFDYQRKAGMPAIHSLVSAFFHPRLPLIGLNYTPVAHNVLHEFPDGWTLPLRLCRGIIFDGNGELVAFPFIKFFNLGEHPETAIEKLAPWPFEATEKMDGHLAIIFQYNGEFIMTTRGDFMGQTAVAGNKLLAKIAKNYNWKCAVGPGQLEHCTLLCEFLDPITRVNINYSPEEDGFVLVGANYWRPPLAVDHDFVSLGRLGRSLGLNRAEIWGGKTLSALRAQMRDRAITGKEGYVIRFQNGLRVKVKYETYIGLMVKGKLSYTYLMNRIISGNLEKMLSTLEEEVHERALLMLGKIFLCLVSGTEREKRQKLYGLVHEDEATSYYKSVCRDFVKAMAKIA